MPQTILELNDSEMLITQGDRIMARSPGIAVVNGDQVQIGEEAVAMSRLNPRNTITRFWSELGYTDIGVTSTRVRHYADLAYAHLLALHEKAGKPKQMLMAVPGSFSAEQLSMLLGLAEASPFEVVGLLDSAVAAAAAAAGAPSGTCQHVDIQLHHAVVTTLDVSEQVQRVAVKVIEGAGQIAFHDKCAAVIADLFIQQARLDPLHHARTEQALYDRLPGCISRLETVNELLLELEFEGTRYKARVRRDAVVTALEPLYSRIAEAAAGSGPCLLSHRAAVLPALAAKLSRPRLLDRTAVFRGCRQYTPSARPEGEGLRFITRLEAVGRIDPDPEAVTEAVTEAAGAVPAEIDGRVTHVLVGNAAYPLSSSPVHVGGSARVSADPPPDALCSLAVTDGRARLDVARGVAAFINDRRAGSTEILHPGDRISFAGRDLVLVNIEVKNLHGEE